MRKTGERANGAVGGPQEPAHRSLQREAGTGTPVGRRQSRCGRCQEGHRAERGCRAGARKFIWARKSGRESAPPRAWAAVLLRMCVRFPRDSPVTTV